MFLKRVAIFQLRSLRFQSLFQACRCFKRVVVPKPVPLSGDLLQAGVSVPRFDEVDYRAMLMFNQTKWNEGFVQNY